MRHSVDYVTIDGQKVEVELFMPEGNVRNQAILFLHGWTGKPNTRAAKLLAENGYTALTVVFRGHPGSDGDMSTITRQNALDDAIAAYDYLKSNLPEGMPICVTGSSYGSKVGIFRNRFTVGENVKALHLLCISTGGGNVPGNGKKSCNGSGGENSM
jgi:esterase/lipase